MRISATLIVAEQVLPGWLVSLHSVARGRGEVPPDVVLTATNNNRVLEAVRTGAADLGFLEGPRAPRGLRSTAVACDELVVVVRPERRWALELSTSAAVRAGFAPAVLSGLAVADDVFAGRVRVVPVDDVDLRGDLRAVWQGGRTLPAGAVRDLLGHLGSARRRSH